MTTQQPGREAALAALAGAEFTDDFMAEYVREHRCFNAIRGVSLADWDRGVRVIEERARLAAIPASDNEGLRARIEAAWPRDDAGRDLAVWHPDELALALALTPEPPRETEGER